jgi:hypothetical protein
LTEANEKYKGDALLQKGYTVDFLTKKRKKNEGEIPQFYVENSHPAIIEPDEFDAVQAELERRGKLGRPVSCNNPFSARIVCGECGGWYGSKVWHSTSKYRRVIWRCNEKYKDAGSPCGSKKCETPHVTEEDVKARFLEVWNSVAANREELIADCRAAKKALCDCAGIDAELAGLQREVEVVTELSRKAIYENAHSAVNQDEWNERNNGYLDRHRMATERIASLESNRSQRQNKARILETFIKGLSTGEQSITEFDEKLWAATIDCITVLPDGGLVFRFKNGTEVEG